MLQKTLNIKKLFQRRKPEAQVSMITVHSTRCILHVTNLALFGVVIILIIASALIYLMPVTDLSELPKMIEAQKVEISPDTESVDVDSKKEEVMGNEAFSVISKRNVFSHERKEWLVKPPIPKASNLGKKKLVKNVPVQKKARKGNPKKIILHGVVMAGGLKKALINNPLTGVSKKKTLYVEEGDELEGYRVTSIKEDRITLDWYGEEIVVSLFSGLNSNNQPLNKDKVKAGRFTKLEYSFNAVEDTKVVEDIKVEESYNKDDSEVINTTYVNLFGPR